MTVNESLYRKGVVALIRNSDGKFLVGHLHNPDKPGLQFPQGGIEPGETPEDAVHREIFEETQITGLRIVAKSPAWIHYDWPESIRRANEILVGQRHLYFVLESPDGSAIQPKPTDDFDKFEWLTPSQVLERCLGFKRESYAQAFAALDLM